MKQSARALKILPNTLRKLPMLLLMLLMLLKTPCVRQVDMLLKIIWTQQRLSELNEKLNPPAMLGRLEEDVSGMRK